MKWVRLDARNIWKILEDYQERVRRYNGLIKDSGFYLKPVHIVVKKTGEVVREYRYYGKYWWRIEYYGRSGGKPVLKWIYLGKEKPLGLPDPPENPLGGMKFYYIRGEKETIYVPDRDASKILNIIEEYMKKGQKP